MSNTPRSNPDHNDTWDNPTTGESFKFDRHRGWINRKGVRFDGDTMTGTLVVPDTRINGGLLSADDLTSGFAVGNDDIDWENGWQLVPPTDANRAWFDVTFFDGLFMAVSNIESSSSCIMYSSDGINWAEGNVPPGIIKMFGTSYAPDKKIWVGSARGNNTPTYNAVYSYDGKNWESAEWRQDVNYPFVAYSEQLGIFNAIASSSGYHNQIQTSTDGINWFSSSPGYKGQTNFSAVVVGNVSGSDRFVSVQVAGISSRGSYSDDGNEWNSASGIAKLTYRDVTFGGGLFVAVADQIDGLSRVSYSSDGKSWSNVSGHRGDWRGIAYGAGYYVAVSRANTKVYPEGPSQIMYSTDAINWTIHPSISPETNWNAIAYGNGKFVVVGEPSPSGENNVMVLDVPDPNAPGGSDASDLYWNNEKVVVQQSSRTMTSSLSQLSSTISSRSGKAKYLQDSAPPETQTFELSEDSSETVDLTYDNGELWYQPSTNTLHIRDSDEWVSLFQ